MKTYRRDVIKALIRSLEFLMRKLARGKIVMDDVIFGLCKRHFPSKREYAFVRNQLLIDQNGEPNYISMRLAQQELNGYNRRNSHNQEIHGLWVEETLLNGKKGKRALLQIIYGNKADDPLRQVDRRMEGDGKKKVRLLDKKRRGKKVKQQADTLERKIYS